MEKHSELLKYREKLDEIRVDQHKSYDRTVITLSSSAIGISLFLLSRIVEAGNIEIGWTLIMSWVLYILTISLTLGSFLAAAADAKHEILIINDEILNGGEPESTANGFRSLTILLNHFSLGFFLVATFFLLLFFWSNALS